MIKNCIVMEVKKGERTYQFFVSSDSPLGELYDVLFEMKSFVINKIKESEKDSSKEESNGNQQ